MAVPISTRRWFDWPSRLALLVGIGALSAAGAEAAPVAQSQQPQGGGERFGELRVWSEDGRIYLAEPDAAIRELQLGDTAEARRLRELLQQDGGTKGGVRLDRMILAGGGGSGFDWAPPGQKRNSPAPTASSAAPSVTGQSTVPARTIRRPASGPSANVAHTRSADKD